MLHNVIIWLSDNLDRQISIVRHETKLEHNQKKVKMKLFDLEIDIVYLAAGAGVSAVLDPCETIVGTT